MGFDALCLLLLSVVLMLLVNIQQEDRKEPSKPNQDPLILTDTVPFVWHSNWMKKKNTKKKLRARGDEAN